jgi:hypothetical protein
MGKLLLGIAILAVATQGFADQGVDVNGNNPRFDDFYTVSEQAKTQKQDPKISLDPVSAAQDFFSHSEQWTTEIQAQVISLLNFDHHNEDYGNVGTPYNRKEHFGGWIRPKNDSSCLNTRGKVLVRDSKTEVTLASGGCTVARGEWDEPYTGQTVKEASEIQIDHFVPLKNAYVSGAWKWNFAKRCLYANFMGNDFHLLSTDGHENMAKSDNTPQAYMPPNQAYRCQYLQQWLKVKLIWDLGLTPPEKAAVESLVQQNNCDLSKFKFSVADLQSQRAFMADNANLCR